MKRVVIVGGGFGGVRTARRLRNKKNLSVTLINDSEDFRYSPALYRAATGYKMGMARLPLEWMLLESSNVELVVGKVTTIDIQGQIITLDSGKEYEYDYIVLSLGSVTSYFGIKGLQEESYGVKSPQEVLVLREHLHSVLTKDHIAEHSVVVVGGGPTGVEIAGAMQSYLNRIASNHRIKRPHHIKVVLVEAAPQVLPAMSSLISKRVEKRLLSLGVNVLSGTKVSELNNRGLVTSSGILTSHTVIWTAGTTINPFYEQHKDIFSINQHKKIIVNERLQAGRNIYVIGDNAATPLSGTAISAVQHANFVSKDIVARVNRRNRPKKYSERPLCVVPVGKSWAIVRYRKLFLSGRMASWLRRIADYVGYSDVLGLFKALTIWKYADFEEQSCQICQKNKRYQ